MANLNAIVDTLDTSKEQHSFLPFQALLTTDPFTCASPILDPSDPFTLPTDPLNPFDISNLPSTLSTFQHANSLAALVALNDTLDQGWQYAEHFITDHPDPEPQDPITSSITSLSQTIISSSSNNKLRVTPKTPKSLEGTGAQAFRLSPMKPKTPTQRKKRVVPYVTRKPPKPTPTPSTTADSLTLSFQRLHATLQSTNSPTTAVQFINDATDGNPKSSPGHDLEGIRRRSKPVTPRKRKPRVNEASSAPEKTSDEGFERLLFGCADEMDFTTLEMMGMREEMLTIPCAAVRPELVTAPSAMTKESVVVERVVHEDLLGPAMEEVEVDEAEQNFLTFLDADEDEMTGFEMTESDILL
ncbi:hypothetical protein BC829DRAFT_421787 [Chytridium lagenaria]|nr:hypothetical protein BC829DRAFT_421787 [Chytridium lagenaria]